MEIAVTVFIIIICIWIAIVLVGSQNPEIRAPVDCERGLYNGHKFNLPNRLLYDNAWKLQLEKLPDNNIKKIAKYQYFLHTNELL